MVYVVCTAGNKTTFDGTLEVFPKTPIGVGFSYLEGFVGMDGTESNEDLETLWGRWW